MKQDELTFRKELYTASPSLLLKQRSSTENLLGGVNIIHPTSPTTSAASISSNRTRNSSITSSLGGLRLDNIGLPSERVEQDENEEGTKLGNWLNGKEIEHGSPILDQDLANAEAIDDGFTGCKFFPFSFSFLFFIAKTNLCLLFIFL